jgi:hypothetical protein
MPGSNLLQKRRKLSALGGLETGAHELIMVASHLSNGLHHFIPCRCEPE